MPELLLVVEIRANVPEQESDDTELKSYMVGRSCPVGMLVTTEKVSVYRNRYKGYTPQSVDIIGGCPTSELIGALPQRALAEADLEARVQNWLESLQTSPNDRGRLLFAMRWNRAFSPFCGSGSYERVVPAGFARDSHGCAVSCR